jgi:hypothetical protein
MRLKPLENGNTLLSTGENRNRKFKEFTFYATTPVSTGVTVSVSTDNESDFVQVRSCAKPDQFSLRATEL